MIDDKKKEEKRTVEEEKMEERVLLIKRVSKKTPGGNYISFTALATVGDKHGNVGLGHKRGLEVPQAIKKALNYAKKHMIHVPIYKGTLPHEIRVKYKAASIILKPAPQGAGLKAGSVVRSILTAVGITNASAKILRSRNQITNAYAVMKALSQLKSRKS